MKGPRVKMRLYAWVVSTAASAALLGLVLFFADVDTVFMLVRQMPWWLLLLGVGVLLLEGVCSALRIKLMIRGPVSLRDAFIVTAWWVFGLATLPARLGELAGMHMLQRRLGHSFGEALNNLSVQRLFDVAILFAVGAVAVAAQAPFIDRSVVVVLSGVLACVVLFALVNLAAAFAAIARVLLPLRRRGGFRQVLRTLLQARRAARSLLTRRRLAALAGVSVAKWGFNLGGLALVILAFVPALAALQGVSVAVIYNLSAVIPLQTVGGIGIGEVSLAGGLAWYGHGAATAASAAILLRLVLIGAPVLFWLIVVATDLLAGSGRRPAGASTAK